MIRLTAYVSGRVQRTGYRAKVVSLAKEMGLVGFVQNRPDGQVLVIAEGERKDLEKFASALRIKNAIIDVENVSLQYSQGSGQYSSFKKITGPDEIGERLDDGIEILKELVVVLKDVKEDTKSINIGISELKKDAMDTILEKYFELSREIAEIKATLSEIKAKAS
jgi:acylphosphatase